MLQELRKAGDGNAMAMLLARDPAEHADLTDPGQIAQLVRELRLAGDEQALTVLLARDPAQHADLTDLEGPYGVIRLLEELRAAGADQTITAPLADKAWNAGLLGVGEHGSAERIQHGRDATGAPLPPWDWH